MPRERILLGHGSGGKLSHELIKSMFLPQLTNPILQTMDDSAVCSLQDHLKALPGKTEGKIALTTDSYVVRPLFFPGGDIGRLAVCGTVNDLSMVGATPLFLSAAFILEEGLLERPGSIL